METRFLFSGKRYRFFLINRFKYEGKLITQDDDCILMFDDAQQQKILILINALSNVEFLEEEVP